MNKILGKVLVLFIAILTLTTFSNEVSAETLDPLNTDKIEQTTVPRDTPYKIWHERFLTTNASFPEKTQFVTQIAYGVLYRGHLSITRRTDGQNGAVYEGWLYHPDYSGGDLPIPARVEEK